MRPVRLPGRGSIVFLDSRRLGQMMPACDLPQVYPSSAWLLFRPGVRFWTTTPRRKRASASMACRSYLKTAIVAPARAARPHAIPSIIPTAAMKKGPRTAPTRVLCAALRWPRRPITTTRLLITTVVNAVTVVATRSPAQTPGTRHLMPLTAPLKRRRLP